MGSIWVSESAYGSPQAPVVFSHKVVNSGTHTCIANAVQTISAPGCLATDLAFVFVTLSVGSRYVLRVVPGADQIVCTLSGDPTIAGTLNWIVLRAC